MEHLQLAMNRSSFCDECIRILYATRAENSVACQNVSVWSDLISRHFCIDFRTKMFIIHLIRYIVCFSSLLIPSALRLSSHLLFVTNICFSKQYAFTRRTGSDWSNKQNCQKCKYVSGLTDYKIHFYYICIIFYFRWDIMTCDLIWESISFMPTSKWRG